MRYLFFFALFFAAFTVASATPAFAAKSSKSEPAPVSPEDRVGSNDDENAPGSFEETYEGNDRDDEYSDLFRTVQKENAEVIKTVTEDRGSYLVITTTRQIPASEDTFCYYITVQKIEKKTGEVLNSNTVYSCQDQVL